MCLWNFSRRFTEHSLEVIATLGNVLEIQWCRFFVCGALISFLPVFLSGLNTVQQLAADRQSMLPLHTACYEYSRLPTEPFDYCSTWCIISIVYSTVLFSIGSVCYCIVLYSTVLFCILAYCSVLYCSVLYFAVLLWFCVLAARPRLRPWRFYPCLLLLLLWCLSVVDVWCMSVVYVCGVCLWCMYGVCVWCMSVVYVVCVLGFWSG